jgi:cAMP-dependent protein kinase regulator
MGCGSSKKKEDAYAEEKKPEAEKEEEEEEDEDDELDEPPPEIDYSKLKGARASISAEQQELTSPDDVPKYEKSDDAKLRVRKAIDASFVFNALNVKEKERVVESIKEVTLGSGETVIKQGDMVAGEDNGLYVVESGELTVMKGDEEVMKYDSPGSTFGELALLYNAPRAATVITNTDCTLWALERTAFNVLVKGSMQARRAETDALLQKVAFLEQVSSEDRTRLADAVKYVHYKSGDVVFSQGEEGNTMYIVASGKLSVEIDGKEVTTADGPLVYESAAFFGELALLSGTPRKATVKAVEECEIIAIDRAAFKRLLGKAEGFMREYAKEKYGLDV